MHARRPNRIHSTPARRVLLAFALAYLLVLQLVVVGVMSGVQAAPGGGADAVICNGAPDEGHDGSLLPGHLDCCRRGCPMVGSPGLVPVVFQFTLHRFVVGRVDPPKAKALARMVWRDRERARGPPRLATMARAPMKFA